MSILEMARSIHPGWITRCFHDNEDWFVYHQCVDCGFTVEGRADGKDEMLTHTRAKHKGAVFALELYRFRASIHSRHVYYGLEAFEWRQ